jgi:hypothetical protein
MQKRLETLENQVAAVTAEEGVRREKMDVTVTLRKRGQGTGEMEELPWRFDLLFPAKQRWLIATRDLVQRRKRRQRGSRFRRRLRVVPRLTSQTILARKAVRYSGW